MNDIATYESLSAERRALFTLRLMESARGRPSRIPRRSAEVPPVPSFAQERLWFLAQLEPESPYYNVAGAVRLLGKLDVNVLEKSLNEVLRRHEVLRTTFVMVDGRAVQVIASERQIEIPVVVLCGLPEVDREAEVHRLVTEEAQRPFDLATGPLLWVGLVALEAEEHVLLINMHHIISDGWSIGILIREFVAQYEAFRAGRPSLLPELPIQYADYAVWQREWLQGEVLERQLSYWKKQLQGAPAVLQLPTDRARPVVQSHRGATYRFTVSRAITEQLKALSQRENATLFMVLLAAFQVLLSRYSGQRDICVGTPVANRRRVEIEGLIGFFVNTLVSRTDLSGNPSFTELLRRVREVCLGAQAHQDLPFEKLVEELASVRDLSHSPLFQVMFVLQNASAEVLKLPGLEIGQLESDTQTAKFDLTLSITEGEDDLDARFEYSTDLFDEPTIARLAGHYGVLLESLLAKPEAPLSDLAFLTKAERHQLLVEWNATEAVYSQDKCLHQLLEEQVEEIPHEVAIVFEDQQLTYSELNAKANQLAHYLRSLGIRPNVLVGLCVERSLEMMIGLLGILKAGGAYVPIDPTFPRERIAYTLQDAGIDVLLTQETWLEHLPSVSIHVICLDSQWTAMAREPIHNPEVAATPENLAYVIYTSGSTGRSKGVAIAHRGLVNYTQFILQQLPEYPGLQFATVSTIAADLGNTILFASLASGGCLHVLSYDITTDGCWFAEYISRCPIDVLKIVPVHLSALLNSAEGTNIVPRKVLLFGGDVLPDELIKRVSTFRPECRVINHYGPTETTIGSLVFPLTAERQLTGESPTVPIGRPIVNTQVYILDLYLEPVPAGVSGELFIGGIGLAQGYLNRPDLTAERFIPNPFSDQPGARLYRTGDRARYSTDGAIEFLGRADHQLKIRGFRIEPGEIEARLRAHPDVREAVVAAWEDTSGIKRLAAYVVPTNAALDPVVLRNHVQSALPDYMVPSAFTFLDSLPLTPNGKVDRKGLPAPDVSAQLAHQYVAPRNATEEVLATIWAKVLGVERVGIHDNFFELGGHSLLATQVVSRIRSSFEIEFPLRDLFNATTIVSLAEHIDIARFVRSSSETAMPPRVAEFEEGEL